ncbi:hypothetical protein PCK1_002974 [Pneumocystis canis]|nr:hypothetical protein PCK1_002974 [Pneumocystis canis]
MSFSCIHTYRSHMKVPYSFFESQKSRNIPFLTGLLVSSISYKYLYNHYVIMKTRKGHQYAPRYTKYKKTHKGRISVPIGMSTKGSTIVYGDFGMRLKEHGVRFTAKQLQTAEMMIKRAIKSFKGAKVYTRISTHTAVCVKGNEVYSLFVLFSFSPSFQTRMGKGKGSFHHWAARVPVGRVVFEIGGGSISSEVAMETLRQVEYKLPGKWEIIKRGAPARIGLRHIVQETLTKNTEE